MDPTKSLVEQYRAEVNLNTLQLTLTSPNKHGIEGYLRATFEGNGTTLKFQESGQTTLIFASTHKQGTQPIEWISLARVPTHLSVESMIKNTEEAVAA